MNVTGNDIVDLDAQAAGDGADPARWQPQARPGDLVQEYTAAAEVMAAGAAAKRWPQIEFGTDPVLFQPDAGVIDAERAMAAMRGIAAARGAEICYGSPVLRVTASMGEPWCTRRTGRGRPRRSSWPSAPGCSRCSARRFACLRWP